MLSFLFAFSVSKAAKSDTCELCYTAVKIVREAVNSGFTDDQVKTALKQSCPTLPSALVPVCQKALGNIEQILKDVHAGKDDKYICSTYGFCSSAKSDVTLLARKANTVYGDAACDVCTGIVGLVEDLLKEEATQEAIIEALDKLCDTMTDPLKSLCETLVGEYIPVIINLIEQGIEKAQICTKLGFCTDKTVFLKARQANGITCTICTLVVEAVERAMTSTTVESEIIALVEKICDQFPAPFSTLCDSLVQQYVPQIMEWLEQGLESLDICTKIGLCTAEEVAIRRNANGITCTLCTTVVSAIEKAMTSTTVESEIIALVEKLCAKIEAPYSTLCNSLVEQYIPTIMQWLEQGLEKIEICQKIGLCATLTRKPNGITCTLCTKVVDAVEKAMVSTIVESEIIALVEKLCAEIPAPFSTICNSLVEQYVPQIMEWLEQGLESIDICQKIGLCDIITRKPNGITCSLCTMVVEAVEKAMVSTKVESEIIALVEKLCAEVPAPFSTICNSLVEQYVPQIMEWLEQGLESADICKKIGLCDAITLARIPTQQSNGITCDICKDFFKWAGEEVEKYTVPYLWKLVSEECPKVPYLKYFCQIINEQNIETFVNLLVSAVTPEEACQFIRIC